MVVVLYVLVEICGFLVGECGISRSEVIYGYIIFIDIIVRGSWVM